MQRLKLSPCVSLQSVSNTGKGDEVVDLAKIEKVDLQKAWPKEAADFTPWLAKNISKLGEALSLDLELRSVEAPVGKKRLDILAHDVGNNRPVVIENQLRKTDDSHLGQLLAYAAGYHANVVVWIAREFSDEHRAALDFLNGRTGDDTEFFGVVVELWKIEDSRPAVNFDLVVTPNDWRPQLNTKSQEGAVSERNENYREFFQPLVDTLRQDHQFTNVRKAQPQSWHLFAAGSRGVAFAASFALGGKARVAVDINDPDRERNKQLFDQLVEHKEDIEVELDEPLDWARLDHAKMCRIATLRQGTIDDDDEMLEETRKWMVEKLLNFRRVFGPRLAELVANNEV